MLSEGYGFTYRGVHCSALGVNLLRYRIHTPELREHEEEIAGRAGVVDYGTELGKRMIELTIDITPNDTPFKLRQSQIYNWLKPTLEPGPLIFDEIPDRVFYAKLTGQLGAEQFNRYGTFEITMKCVDPFAYGHPETVAQTTITASPTSITVSSAGTEPTPPVIELTNNGTQTIGEIRLSVEYQID